MKSRFWILALFIMLMMSLLLPQTITQAATVTYTTCPSFSALETDASTPGIITFNTATLCTVSFANEIYIDSAVTITNIGAEVVFDGGDYVFHFDIDSTGDLILNNLVLRDGYGYYSGSIFNEGTLTVTNSVFDDNYAEDYGGAIYSCCGTVTLTNTNFIGNVAEYNVGGAIFTDGGTLTVTGGSFDSNYAYEYGGAIYSYDATVIVTGAYFENNVAYNDYGGAIYSYDGSLTVTNSTFEGNYSEGGGAILQEYGTTTITGSTFFDNYGYYGGAVTNGYGTMTISHSSFYNNEAEYGGALYNYDGVLSVVNSTFYGNYAYDAGGMIYDDAATTTFTHVTIVNNFAVNDGDTAYVDDSTITFIASIIAGGDCYLDSGAVNDGGNNIQYLAPGCVGTDTDPLLGAFAGGVLVPADGSPAIDAMPACIVATDQLGTARPQGLGCDIGAIEGGGGFVVPIPVDVGPIVLGCVFDTPSGMELSNVPDDTYCTVLMRNGGVINYPGAVPAELIGLGVLYAVDVYRLEGGRSIVEFPDYGRICLRGNGRMFYMDARNAPRYPIEMPTEQVDGMTCAWIPAAGTLILTNN